MDRGFAVLEQLVLGMYEEYIGKYNYAYFDKFSLLQKEFGGTIYLSGGLSSNTEQI
jgi:hypothetical protein